MSSSLRVCSFVCALILASCSRHPEDRQAESYEILTPPVAAAPRINSPKVFGVRPGSPFLFQIAATGERPLEFAAENLPDGLLLDRSTGLISGAIAAPGRQLVRLSASNKIGAATKELTIVVGDEIALTPPMGWNSWNIWSGSVSQEKVRAAARAMIASGLRDHGWTYVNIDDGWQGVRGGELNAIQPNKKFPDMPALAKEVHELGLKVGIYSTPWRTSFHGHIGSSADNADGSNEWMKSGQYDEFYKYKFPPFESSLNKIRWLKSLANRLKEKQREQITKKLRTFGEFSFVRQDVAQWSAWQVDYLKYDWVPTDLAHAEEMRESLRRSDRDIVFSVANNAPFPIAPQISNLANSWRTSGDVKDNWPSMSKTGFTRDRWAPFSRPGHYNDPDMLVLGEVGWGKPRRTNLSPNEQYTQMSLWCLLSAPLLLGCDLEKLDPFTLGLLTNDEVIEIDQDPLCKQARRVAHHGSTEIFAKPLQDGSWAIGLFNRGSESTRAVLEWTDIGISGPQTVRDLWRQKDVGIFTNEYEASVPQHGVVLIRVFPRKNA
ncbi:MAG: putative Ig domain-containing protein [Chthoniobacterales bacterium]